MQPLLASSKPTLLTVLMLCAVVACKDRGQGSTQRSTRAPQPARSVEPGTPTAGFATLEEAQSAAVASLERGDLSAFEIGTPTEVEVSTLLACDSGLGEVLEHMKVAPVIKAQLEKEKSSPKPLGPLSVVEVPYESVGTPLKPGEGSDDCRFLVAYEPKTWEFTRKDARGETVLAGHFVIVPLGANTRFYILRPD
ncbi:MAG: hypothetical protein U0271_46080 [Polyangiaceae bacterium]